MFLKVVVPIPDQGQHSTVVEIERIYSSPPNADNKIRLEFHGSSDVGDHESMYVDPSTTQVYLMNDQGSTIDTIC